MKQRKIPQVLKKGKGEHYGKNKSEKQHSSKETKIKTTKNKHQKSKNLQIRTDFDLQKRWIETQNKNSTSKEVEF